jgi:hypothetical protein
MVRKVWRARFANVSLLLVSIGAMLFLSEVALRVFYPQQLGVWHQTRDGLAIHRPNSTTNYFDHEIQINSLGMRDREHTIKKKEGTFRILLLGDSFLEALQVRFEDSFPKLLEDRLRDSGISNVEVINVAVSGWGTEDELAYLVRYGKRLEPDLVLVAMTLHNDVSDNLRERFYTLNDGRLQARPVRESPIREYLEIQAKGLIASHSHLFQLWRKYWYRNEIRNTGRLLNQHVVQLLSNTSTGPMARGWQLTFQELSAIQIEGRRIGAETVVVLIPLSLQLGREELVRSGASNSTSPRVTTDQKPQDVMIKFGSTHDIEIIDLLPVFKEWAEVAKKDLYLEGDGHWNRDGHLVSADSVASELARRRLVKVQRDH